MYTKSRCPVLWKLVASYSFVCVLDCVGRGSWLLPTKYCLLRSILTSEDYQKPLVAIMKTENENLLNNVSPVVLKKLYRIITITLCRFFYVDQTEILITNRVKLPKPEIAGRSHLSTLMNPKIESRMRSSGRACSNVCTCSFCLEIVIIGFLSSYVSSSIRPLPFTIQVDFDRMSFSYWSFRV